MTKLELISRILEGITGIRKEGNAWLLPEHPEVSLYISLTAEVLTVPRVARVQANADLVAIDTHRGESFFFPTDLVAGCKIGSGDGKPGRSSAGFR